MTGKTPQDRGPEAAEAADAPPQDLAALAARARGPGGGLPPVQLWDPPFCGDIDLVIRRDGTWWYLGTPIGRKALVRLFSTILRRDADGRYYLVTPVEKVGIRVEDVPFLAVAVAVEAEAVGAARRLRFRTNVEDEMVADGAHPIRVETDPVTGEPAPYVLVRDRLEAKIARSVFYELVDLAEERRAEDGGTVLGVRSAGQFFPLGRLP